jgi:hypothetical protein
MEQVETHQKQNIRQLTKLYFPVCVSHDYQVFPTCRLGKGQHQKKKEHSKPAMGHRGASPGKKSLSHSRNNIITVLNQVYKNFLDTLIP